jgi:hypothetical protein
MKSRELYCAMFLVGSSGHCTRRLGPLSLLRAPLLLDSYYGRHGLAVYCRVKPLATTKEGLTIITIAVPKDQWPSRELWLYHQGRAQRTP